MLNFTDIVPYVNNSVEVRSFECVWFTEGDFKGERRIWKSRVLPLLEKETKVLMSKSVKPWSALKKNTRSEISLVAEWE